MEQQNKPIKLNLAEELKDNPFVPKVGKLIYSRPVTNPAASLEQEHWNNYHLANKDYFLELEKRTKHLISRPNGSIVTSSSSEQIQKNKIIENPNYKEDKEYLKSMGINI